MTLLYFILSRIFFTKCLFYTQITMTFIIILMSAFCFLLFSEKLEWIKAGPGLYSGPGLNLLPVR